MKILLSPEDIRNGIQDLGPCRVAVGYIGIGWEKYISAKDLAELIVSPRVGSNPIAIEQIAKIIGWGNVYLLERLHSKIYLGKRAAIVGSCNLSANALDVGGLCEAAALTKDVSILANLEAALENYKKLAIRDHPTETSKVKRLRRLMLETNWASFSGKQIKAQSETKFVDYTGALFRVHVAWYDESGGADYNESEVRRSLQLEDSVDVDASIRDAMVFRNGDPIEEGDWVLCWRCNKDGMPHKSARMNWMYVHRAIREGSANEEYPLLAAELTWMPIPAEPFELNHDVERLIKAALCKDEFECFRPLADDKPWSTKQADDMVTRLFDVARVPELADDDWD